MPYVKPIASSVPPHFWVLTPKTGSGSKATIVEIHQDAADGPMLFSDEVNLAKANPRTSLQRALNRLPGLAGVTAADVLAVWNEFQAYATAPQPKAPFALTLRQKEQPVATAERVEHTDPVAALKLVLDPAVARPPNFLIEWPAAHADLLMLVDVDYHPLPGPPDEQYTEALAHAVRPQPVAWWRSHGGGLHLIYAALAPYTASELVVSVRDCETYLMPTWRG